jgi:hypothetical protein
MERALGFFDVNDAELQLVRKQSALLLQKRDGGFSGELKSSGALVENYVKGMINKHLPNNYRISSGYVATPNLISGRANLIQHDILITDTRTPPLYSFGIGDIEVVAAEAVCGIIEVKRTLTKKSLSEAAEHLRKTFTTLADYRDGIKSKQSATNIIGPTLNLGSLAPIYAIIALDCDKEEMDEAYFKEQVPPLVTEFIDLIWVPPTSLSASFGTLDSSDIFHYPSTVSRSQDGLRNHCVINWFKENEQSRVYAGVWSLLRTWIKQHQRRPSEFS